MVFWPVRAVLSRRTCLIKGRRVACVLILWEEPADGFAPHAFDEEIQTDLENHPELMRAASWRPTTALKPAWDLAMVARLPEWPLMHEIPN
jgi:hypothetical protein